MNKSFEETAARLAPAIFVVLWSTGFIGTKYVINNAEPLTYLAIRMAFVVVVMAVIAAVVRPKWPDRTGVFHSAAAGILVGLYNPKIDPLMGIMPGLEAFVAAVPRDVVVVLDEAYNEYLRPELRTDSVAWVRRHPNLLVSRTFSKAFGLAGLRVGYGIAQPALTDLLNRVRQPFNVNAAAQAAF